MAETIQTSKKTFILLDPEETEAMRKLLELGFIKLCETESTTKDHESREELKVIAGNSFDLLKSLSVKPYETETT